MRSIAANILFGIILASTMPARAELPDPIQTAILDHVTTVTQFDGRGTTRLALLDSLIQIGSHEKGSILDIQIGYTADLDPEAGETKAGNFIAGGMLRVDSLLSDDLDFPDHYKFLQSLEHGPAAHYDFRDKEWYVSYQVGLAFKLEPKR